MALLEEIEGVLMLITPIAVHYIGSSCLNNYQMFGSKHTCCIVKTVL